MSLGISVEGQAAKRGPLRRTPAAEQLIESVGSWFHENATDTLRSTRLGQAGPATPELRVDLHPAADAVRFVVHEEGRVTVDAPAAPVGPGYETYVARLMARMGEDLGIAWATGWPERPEVERRHLLWLHGTLQRVHEARERRLGAVQLCRVEGDHFDFDGALATALGPRDDAWLAAAVRDPRVAVDILPWWPDAMDGRYLLDRALALMWTEIRWRVPAGDAEAAVFQETVKLLHRAYPLDPSLPFPWREWCDLLRLGGSAYQLAAMVAERAAAVIGGPLVGYRRRPVTIVHAGWSLEVPGTFAERWSDGEWWGGEAGRNITLAGVETGLDDAPMSPEAFLAQVASHLGSDALTHRAGPVAGRASLGVDPSSGVEVAVLEGYSAVVGRGAAIKVVIDDPADWEWALRVWRSLEPAA